MIAEIQPIDTAMENTYLDKIKDICDNEKSTRELLCKVIQERRKQRRDRCMQV
ncbi:hypothetical protein MHBO_004226 [Bonamia ostreae]|uniref:Uncharacterized protein n=1 Tax=Bonamia ostreae TaxID=126728 RepID=A0ABV2ATH7_9EUKA